MACEARLSRLPEGVLPVTAVPPRPGVCFVCLEEEEDDEDFILQCDRCKVYVHMDCYSVREPPHGRLWLCDVCSVGASPPPACALCPVAGGALKRTTCGRWCHPSCSLWLPEPALRKDLEYMGLHGLIDGLSLVHQSRGKLPCQVCKQRYGACVQCCNPGCYSAFHLMCARQQGCATQLLPDSDSEDEMEEAEWTESAQQTGQARASAARHASSGSSCKEGGQASEGSGDENREVPPNGAIAPETTEKVQEGRLGKKMSERAKKERRALRQQGVKINNARLLVFCPRHTPPELAGKESLFTRSPGAVDGCSAAPTRAGSGHVPANVPRGASQIAGAIASAGAVPSFEAMEFQRVLEQPGKGCARARCLRGAQRRGPREPQSLIAAASKRLYVSPAPLLLRGPEAGGAGGNSAGGNPLTEVRSACKVHQLAPVAQKPDGQGCMEVLAPSFRARGPAGAGVQVLSVGDRYHAMRRTEGQRIVPGKSGIHGWGAFARVPHAKGENKIIEMNWALP